MHPLATTPETTEIEVGGHLLLIILLDVALLVHIKITGTDCPSRVTSALSTTMQSPEIVLENVDVNECTNVTGLEVGAAVGVGVGITMGDGKTTLEGTETTGNITATTTDMIAALGQETKDIQIEEVQIEDIMTVGMIISTPQIAIDPCLHEHHLLVHLFAQAQ